MNASNAAVLFGASLCLNSLYACSTTTDGAVSPSSEPTTSEQESSGDGEVSGLVDGQSGSEGSELRIPCFFEEQSIFTVRVTSTAGGCFEGEVLKLHSESARKSSFGVGDPVGGVMSVFYHSHQIAVGDVAVIQYLPSDDGEEAALSGHVQVSPMNGDQVEIEWLGGTYEYAVADLLSDDCSDMIMKLPNLVEEDPSGEDPDDGIPPAQTPLSCPAE